MSKLPDSARAYEMLVEVDECEEEVTSWEAQFISSIMDQWSRHPVLSQRQIQTIVRLHERYITDG